MTNCTDTNDTKGIKRFNKRHVRRLWSNQIKRKHLYIIGFLTPSILYMIILRFVPLVYTSYLSFFNYNFAKGVHTFIGLENYIKFIPSIRFLGALKFTILFVIVSVTCEFGIGLGLALLFNQPFKGKNIFRNILLIPMFIAPVAVGTIWHILFNSLIGPINYFLDVVGLPIVNWYGTPTTAFIAILISDIWQWTPFTFLLLLAGLQTVNQELYDVASIDGASKIQTFYYITLPMIKSTIFITLMLRLMDAMRIFEKIYVMTYGAPKDSTESLSLLVYKAAFEWFEVGYASAMIVFMICLLGIIYYVFIKKIGWIVVD